MRRALLAPIVLALATALSGQSAPPIQAPPASEFRNIIGRVIDDATGQPLPNVRVSTATTGIGAPVSVTDNDGRFSFRVSQGPQTLVVSKTGFARQQIAVTAGANPGEIHLQWGASISGRVANEFGEPAVQAMVNVRPIPGGSGREATVASAETDDRGEYRIGGLTAGRFAVSVEAWRPVPIGSPDGEAGLGIGLTSDSATVAGVPASGTDVVELGRGEQRLGIDFVAPAIDQPPNAHAVMTDPARAIRMFRFIRVTPGKGSVRGRILSLDGRPLARAQVTLSAAASGYPIEGQTSRSDMEGRFEFRAVPPGRFRVVAGKIGYFASGVNGSGSSASPSIEIGDGESRQGVEIRLAPWGTIEGRILDERGDPLGGARVQLLHERYEAGRRALVDATMRPPLTDDLGRYRLYGIVPGQYIVSATNGGNSGNELPEYARAYFPGTVDPGTAQYTAVGMGATVVGVDFSLAHIKTARISGRLLSARGQVAPGTSLRLVPARASVVAMAENARLQSDGAFEFVNIASGEYVIQAWDLFGNSSWTEPPFVAVPVIVSGDDVDDVLVQTRVGSDVTGRFTFESVNRAEPARSDVQLRAVPANPLLAPPVNLSSAKIDVDWWFELSGISGPRRLQLVRAPAGWALQAIRVNGVEVTDRPIDFGNGRVDDVEVVLTDRVSTLMGTIADELRNPVPATSVIVYSIDSGKWYSASRFLRKTISDAKGAFTIQGLPAGQYYAVAVRSTPSDGDDAWQDPEYLNRLRAGAPTISLTEGTSTTVALRLGR